MPTIPPFRAPATVQTYEHVLLPEIVLVECQAPVAVLVLTGGERTAEIWAILRTVIFPIPVLAGDYRLTTATPPPIRVTTRNARGHEMPAQTADAHAGTSGSTRHKATNHTRPITTAAKERPTALTYPGGRRA